MSFQPINGKPGDVWKNETSKAYYQFIVQWNDSCGLCAQYDHAILEHSWPAPFHFGCNCIQEILYPGAKAKPFVDFRAKVDALDENQRNQVVGAASYKLIKSGLADWSDVVTQSRIRDFHEVVSLKNLDVATLTSGGVDKRTAEEAFKSIHTAAHEIVNESRRRILEALKAKGISPDQVKRAVGERLALRFGVGETQSGFRENSRVESLPTSSPLPIPAPRERPLTQIEIENLFNMTLEPSKERSKEKGLKQTEETP